MEDKNKIIIIVPYFGQFPNYFDLFLKSCEYNKTVDWLIVTNNEYNNLPPNVKLLNMSFSDLESLISTNLNIDIKVGKPYRLCDYRPAFGGIFSHFTLGYDFWGHCDIDMIFGDIRKFVTEDILNSHNKILAHGHFTLYRNNEEVNNYFQLTSPGEITFLTAINAKEAMFFDEIGINNILNFHGIKQYNNPHFFIDILPQFGKFRMSTDNRMNRNKNVIFYWKEGRIYRKICTGSESQLNEYMYIHLQKRAFGQHRVSQDANKILITPHGFIEAEENKNYTKYYNNNRKHSINYYINRYKNISLIKINRKIKMKLNYQLNKNRI